MQEKQENRLLKDNYENFRIQFEINKKQRDAVTIQKEKTVEDARKTIAKVKRISKPYARKIQILTVLEQRARFGKKPRQAAMAKAAKLQLKRTRKKK